MNRPLHLSYTKEEYKLLSDLIELRLLLSKKKQAYDQGRCDQESLFEMFCLYRQQLIAHPELWDNEHIYHYLRALPDKDPCVDGHLIKVHVFQYFGESKADNDYIAEAKHAIEQSGGEDRRFFDRYIQAQSEMGQQGKRRDLRNTQQYLRCSQPGSYMQTVQYYSTIRAQYASELADTLDDEVSRQRPGVAESQKQLHTTLAMLDIPEASIGKSHLYRLSGAIDHFVYKPNHRHYRKLMKVIVKLLAYNKRLQQKDATIDIQKYRDQLLYMASKSRKLVTCGFVLLAVLARAIEHQDVIQEALTPAPTPTTIPHNDNPRDMTYFTSSGYGSFEAQRDSTRKYKKPSAVRDWEFITGLLGQDIDAAMHGRDPRIRSLVARPYTPGSPDFCANRLFNSMGLRDAMIPTKDGDSLIFIGPGGEQNTIAYTDYEGALREIGKFPFATLDTIHRLLFSELMVYGLAPWQKNKVVVDNVISYPLQGASGVHSVEGQRQVSIYLDYRLQGDELFLVMLHELLHSYVRQSRNIIIREGKTERLTCFYDWRVRGHDELPHHYYDLVFADIVTEWLMNPYVQAHAGEGVLETATIASERVNKSLMGVPLNGPTTEIDLQTKHRINLLTANPNHDIHSSSLYFFLSDQKRDELKKYIHTYKHILKESGKNHRYIRGQFLTPSMADQLEKIISGDALVDERGQEKADDLMRKYEQVKNEYTERESFINQLHLDGNIFGEEIHLKTNTPVSTYRDPNNHTIGESNKARGLFGGIDRDIDRKREYTLYGMGGILIMLLLVMGIGYEYGRRKNKHMDKEGNIAAEYSNHFDYIKNMHTILLCLSIVAVALGVYDVNNRYSQEIFNHTKTIHQTTTRLQELKSHTSSDAELRPLESQRRYHERVKNEVEKNSKNFYRASLALFLSLGVLVTRDIWSGDKWRKKRPLFAEYKTMLPQESGEKFVQRQKVLLWNLLGSYQAKNPVRKLWSGKDPMQQRNAIQSEAYVHYAQNIGQIMQTPSMGSMIPSKGQADQVMRTTDPYDRKIEPAGGAVAKNVDRKKTARLARQDEVIVRTHKPMIEETRNSSKKPHFVVYYNLDPLRPHDQQTPQERVAYIVERFLSPLYSLMQGCQETAKKAQASIALKCVRLDHVVYTIYRKPGQGGHNLKAILEDLYRLYFDHFVDTNMIPDIPIDELCQDEQSVAGGRVVYRILVLLTGQNDEVNHTIIAQSHYNIQTTRVDYLRNANDLRDAIHDVQKKGKIH